MKRKWSILNPRGSMWWLPNSHKVQCHARLNRVLPTHPKQGKNPTIQTHGVCNETTLQGSLTYPTKWEKENHRLKMPFLGDMLVPWRVITSFLRGPLFFCCARSFFHPILFGLSGGRPPQEDDCQCQASYFRVECTPSKRIEGIFEEPH